MKQEAFNQEEALNQQNVWKQPSHNEDTIDLRDTKSMVTGQQLSPTTTVTFNQRQWLSPHQDPLNKVTEYTATEIS